LAIGFGETGFEIKRLLVGRRRLIDAAELLQGIAQIAVSLGEVGLTSMALA
jgi:hypothetical protein